MNVIEVPEVFACSVQSLWHAHLHQGHLYHDFLEQLRPVAARAALWVVRQADSGSSLGTSWGPVLVLAWPTRRSAR
ncbi:hypothetical protein E1264_25025 [Actinomadura sp. KC216]|uniref:hypothetical protein n=1 Tax=Actinomadura sp. KC216 TaxID=2530370 RepID=UPI00104FDE00|nr:hypothetical protein [Actinomadura sp. KC216]TDB84310.1 hypothetical protein E1264_25025 [Actinomadura sp. KC216]